MTSPRDPNQPDQPAAGQSGAEGWGQPPQGGPAPWGVPPSQPDWAAPPPPPAWGAPQGSQPPQWGSGAPQGWSSQSGGSNKKGCLIAAVVVLVLIGALVVGCAVTLVPALMTGTSIENASNGEITNVSYNWNNGTGTFTITVAAGIGAEEAGRLACEVVEPKLKGTQYENTHFVIVDESGSQLATEQTCP